MMMIASFIFFLLSFVVIGALSAILARGNNADYLLASSSVKPWLVALSAIATTNSGWMFVGLIGFTYTAGLEAAWLLVGWIVGDLFISFFVHRKLREHTESNQAMSYGALLARWNGTNFRILRALVGLVTLVLLGTYAAAQLNAGSKALHALFGWTYETGAIIGALIVVIYCFAGGIRASIWTDAAQSFVMFFAMLLMFILSVSAAGGWGGFTTGLENVDPDYISIVPSDPQFGVILFLIGWFFAGVSVIGQPHIMVRFMAMDDPHHMARLRFYYYSWYATFAALSVGCGLAARLLLPETGDFDAELGLPMLAMEILPPALIGLVLAGLFAATMSTADSQILSCTAAITRDLPDGRDVPYWVTKLATVGITLFALGIALWGPDSVFSLVVIAWAALGAAFGPLLIVYCCGGRPNELLAIGMMLGGLGVIWLWREAGYHESNGIYEVLPGMLTGFVIYGLGHLAGLRIPADKISGKKQA